MSTAPPELVAVADLVDRRVSGLLSTERRRWDQTDPRLSEVLSELERMSVGGKRLRAAFCYWTWAGAHEAAGGAMPSPNGSSSESDRAVDAGAAFELLQTFALIHDDVMDDADTRRGEPTIHVVASDLLESRGWRGEPRRYGEGVAILVGDLSHVYADQLIGTHSPQARRLWDELRIELNLGQYLDLRAAAAGGLDRETARRVATFKTALYTIVRPMQVGAALSDGGASDALMDAIDDFGRPVGQAFQLRDDLLGVLGDQARVGKPVGADLREGKATELAAIALERASNAQRVVLNTLGTADLEPDQISAIVTVLHETGAVSEVEARIDMLVEHASEAAAALPFDGGIRQTLVTLANYVAARNH